MLLDSARRVIAAPTIYIGTINTSVLRIAEVYREAITRNSPAIILAHNHPSGDPTPSPEDIELTRTLVNAGRLLDITLVDHVIIGQQRWVSLREQGFLVLACRFRQRNLRLDRPAAQPDSRKHRTDALTHKSAG